MPTTMTLQHAAERLGISQQAAYDMLRAGRLTNVNPGRTALVSSAEVARVQLERRQAALRRIGDEVAFAVRVREIIWPAHRPVVRADGRVDAESAVHLAGLPRGKDALRLLPTDAYAVFGPDVLRAAATEWPRGACATCWSRLAAVVHETRGPDGSPACRVLLGDPCELDAAAWAQQRAQNREKLTRLRQQQEGRRRLDQADRVNAERTAAMRAVQAATRRFTAADAEWRRLPVTLREGGRR